MRVMCEEVIREVIASYLLDDSLAWEVPLDHEECHLLEEEAFRRLEVVGHVESGLVEEVQEEALQGIHAVDDATVGKMVSLT